MCVQVALTHAADWPQFRGPNRDGKSLESGLLKKWPEAGPTLVRTISGLGEGYSSPSIAGGRLYITGRVGGDLKILCFDLSGNKLWEKMHGPAFAKSYPGARAAPTINGDTLYLLSGLGRLAAYRTDNGKEVWSTDVVGKLGRRVPVWGYAESVLVDGDKVICTPGGEKTATLAALDKKSGRVLWTSREVTGRAEYASPILIEYNKVRQIVTMTRGGLIAVSPGNGKLIWRYNRPANRTTTEHFTANCNTPVHADGYVFEATGFQSRGGGAVKLKQTAAGIEVEPAWDTRQINCEHGGYVLVDRYIYANDGKGWSCIELKTGEKCWTGEGPGRGSIVYADGMLYCLGDRGKMALLAADPAACRMINSFQLPKQKGPCWTHPVISDGKLYLRWSDNLYVYDIKE
jgi:outer membrane protein assembly factor BamB